MDGREGGGGGGETDGAGVGGVVESEGRKSGRGGNQGRVTVGVGGPLVVAAGGVPVAAAVVAASVAAVAVSGLRNRGGDQTCRNLQQ